MGDGDVCGWEHGILTLFPAGRQTNGKPNCEPNAGARCAVPTQQAQRERGGLMSCASMPPHVEVSLREGMCVCVCNPWTCENILYRDLCHGILWSGRGHSTVYAKCDLIYGSGTGEWVEWEWTGCPRIEQTVLCSNALSDHLFRIMTILLTFELTAGYGHHRCSKNVLLTFSSSYESVFRMFIRMFKC